MPITVHRDLRSGHSIWADKRKPSVPHGKLQGDVDCEVAVIGSGISGALIAEGLADAGLDVAIFDRRPPVSGSTPASTAMLQYEIDTPLHQLSSRIGKDRAQRIWRRSRLAVDALRERSERLGIDAGQITRSSIYLDGNVLDAKGLELEAQARREVGFEIELLTPKETNDRYGIRGRHAIIGYGNYTADPVRLAAGFLNVAATRGARIFSPEEIVGVRDERGRVALTAASGHRVIANHVIFATGYEMLKGIPKKGNTIISSWSIATKPQPRSIWPTAALIWEASDPYLYIRTTPEGHVICGGEDEEISDEKLRDSKLEEKAAALSKKLAALLPDLETTAEFMWAGSFGDSRTGTPTIGRIPGMNNCYAAMGYGGNGITFSVMASQILRSAITGEADPDKALFSFHRKF